MATFEEKFFGEKRENYCSSDEEDDDEFDDACEHLDNDEDGINADGGGDPDDINIDSTNQTSASYIDEVDTWSGNSTNTGPKGVIKDWQRFKQLEAEKNLEKERERLMLMKKLCIQSDPNEEKKKSLKGENPKVTSTAALVGGDDFDKEFNELLNDEFLVEYQRKRMAEMIQMCSKQKLFGSVYSLTNGTEFLNAIDKEDKLITIIVHICEDLPVCTVMNNCLSKLAQEYPKIKFCKMIASVAGLSKQFKLIGMPTLLAYKNGQLIGNFVQVSRQLGGDDFYPSDVESFLIEHGIIPDKSQTPSLIRSSQSSKQIGNNNNDGDDEDDDDDDD